MTINPEKKIIVTIEDKSSVVSFSNMNNLRGYIKNKDSYNLRANEHLFNNNEKFLNWLKNEYDVTISTLLCY